MKIKLGTLVNSKEALSKLINDSGKIPTEKAWKLAKAIRKIEGELEDYEKVRIAKIKEYGKENEDGSVRVEEKKMQSFQDDLNQILTKEIEIDMPDITAKDLGDKIELKVILNLDWLIKE